MPTCRSNRGALIAFLSYYPSEREILFAPLARMEVRDDLVRSFRGRELTVFKMQVYVTQNAEQVHRTRRTTSPVPSATISYNIPLVVQQAFATSSRTGNSRVVSQHFYHVACRVGTMCSCSTRHATQTSCIA